MPDATVRFPYGTRLRVRSPEGKVIFVGTLDLHWYGVAEALTLEADYGGRRATFHPELGETFEAIGLEDGW